MTTLLLFAGILLLAAGAELLVRGAAKIATLCGISPLVIGLTIVAYGTSTPELAVNLRAVAAGQADIAIGNVVGSNIFNVLFILGVCALIKPLVVAAQLVRLDVPLMIGASLLVWGMSLDGLLSRWDGVILFVGIVIYTVYAIRQSRKETAAVKEAYSHEAHLPKDPPKPGAKFWLLQCGLILAGLVILVIGAQWVVDSSITIARSFGVSELIIGLTIIAAGTSLPEVATSLVATFRGQRDIAIGNVVGSNLYNIAGILGVSAMLAPGGLAVAAAALSFDIPVMTVVAVACLPIFFTGYAIARWEGAVFLGYYVGYTAYLVLATQNHNALPAYSAVMLWFSIPLTVLTLGVVVWRTVRRPAKV